MDRLEIFQVDAFTDKVFHGNPAAVVLLDEWLNDELLQAIAVENYLSETSFVIQKENEFHIRWFAPNGEISLCGHATLAAGFVLFELDKCTSDTVHFNSMSGTLTVKKKEKRYVLDFPRLHYTKRSEFDVISSLIDKPVLEAFDSDLDCLVLLASERDVAQAHIDLKKLLELPARGLIITSTSSEADFYSRCFYPKHHVPEDPVTGSAHCVLTPFWAERLNKTSLHAIQGSHRKGELFCEQSDTRVLISGGCCWYLKGYLVI